MVGSIQDANRGPRTPLAALIPLLHRAPSCWSLHERNVSTDTVNQFLFQLRKITICKGMESKTGFSDLTLESLESCHPSRAMVTLDDEGVLHWPVIFLYPEFGETDFITSFCENTRYVAFAGTVVVSSGRESSVGRFESMLSPSQDECQSHQLTTTINWCRLVKNIWGQIQIVWG